MGQVSLGVSGLRRIPRWSTLIPPKMFDFVRDALWACRDLDYFTLFDTIDIFLHDGMTHMIRQHNVIRRWECPAAILIDIDEFQMGESVRTLPQVSLLILQ